MRATEEEEDERGEGRERGRRVVKGLPPSHIHIVIPFGMRETTTSKRAKDERREE